MEHRDFGSSGSRWRHSFITGFAAFAIIIAFFTLPQQFDVINKYSLQLSNELVGDQVSVHHNLTSYSPHHDEILETVDVTIACQLSGEMGNNLGKLGHCLSLKYWLESGEFYNSTHKFGYNARVALRHQDHNKWVRGRNDLLQCFPNTRQYDFSELNNDDYNEIYKMQQDFIKRVGDQINADNGNLTQIRDGLELFVSQVAERHIQVYNNASKRNISLPFLYGDRIQQMDPLNDMFYSQLKSFYRFNYTSCCKIKADPDESVFHFRNFKQEMPRKWNEYGFHEASAEQAATILFGHLKEGDKVAIVTRFSGETAQEYVDAFTSRGLKVRVVDGQQGTEDFCLLMSAQKEIVGLDKSTYLLWAGYLGNATRVVAYTMASSRQGSHHRERVRYNFTSPGLKGRFEFPILD